MARLEEHLKTLEPAADKKASIKTLLDRAAKEPRFREVLEHDGISLTAIGNDIRIRHSERDKTRIESSAQVDYFFQRLFALIYLLPVATLSEDGRMGSLRLAVDYEPV